MKTTSKFLTLIAVLMVTMMTMTAFASTNMYALNRVNLRTGPGTDYKVIKVLNPGDVVAAESITEDDDGKPWIKCDTKYGSGYASYYSFAKEGKAAAEYYKSSKHWHSSSHSGTSNEKALKAKDSLSAQTITLVAKRDTKVTLDGKKVKVKAGTKMKAKYFYPDGKALVKAPNGSKCKVSIKNFRTSSGKSIPKLSKKVKLNVAMMVGGELMKKGKKLRVEYYIFHSGELYAYVHEGYINTKYLK